MSHHIARVLRVTLIVAALFSSTSAFATNGSGSNGRGHHHGWHKPKPKPHNSVPEFDPAAAGGIAALLAGGGLLVARGRKGKDSSGVAGALGD